MSAFPFIDDDELEDEVSEEELPLLQEYAYDYENHELLLDENGKTYLVTGNEALRIWIMKALATERFHYTAYSDDFGSEFQDQMVGKEIDEDVKKLELERLITEALMVSPYIQALDDFELSEDGSEVTVSFTVTSVYGDDTIGLPLKEVMI